MASFDAQSLRPDIASILDQADRSSVSAKAVRKALQAKYPNLDIKAHKQAIDSVTTELFTSGGNGDGGHGHEDADVKPKLPSFQKLKRSRSPSANGFAPEPTSSPAFALATTSKSKSKAEEDDAAMARRLQAEFASQSAGRTTRNGTTSSASKKRTAGGKKKSKARVSDDDSEGGGGAAPKKKKRKANPNSGFNKFHLLSPELAAICGEEVASRPRVTKLMWRYIKAHDLQDANKRTDILPDETLHRVLPFARINSFTMAKHISPHLFPFDPEQHAHLVPPPSDDDEPAAPSSTLAASSDDDVKDKKPRAAARAPTADKAGVRGSGRGLSKEEVDTEDEESD
ncbi:hypothetical protein JCM3775_000350 [Rhodotorula graminis]